MIKCKLCGFENLDNSNFCAGCGKKIIKNNKLFSEELKLLTILFMDIKGFTTMSESMEPDEIKDILDKVFKRLSEKIQEENGKVIKYEGDSIMAAFGLEKTTDSDPINACYSALKMQEELGVINSELKNQKGIELSIRIGIHTGKVVVGNIGGIKDIIGDAVNTASRMEQNAPENGILITQDVAKLLKARFKIKSVEGVKLKGKKRKIYTYLLEGKAPFVQRKVLGKETQTIGREKDIKLCIKRFEKVIKSKIPNLYIIEGEPGVGKSRILREFEQYCYKSDKIIHLNKSYFNSTMVSDYNIFKVFFIQRYNVNSEEQLFNVFKSVIKLNKKKLLKYAKVVSYLLGFTHKEDNHLSMMKNNPEKLLEFAFKAFEDFFNVLTASNVFVFFIEDLQWADKGSIKLIQHFLNWGSNLYFICSAREEYKEKNWKFSETKTWTSHVEALDSEMTLRMIQEILDNTDFISENLLNKIINVSKGLPFFIEEILTSLYDREIIKKIDGKWKFDEEKFHKFKVPTSVKMVVQSRIEGLNRETLEVLKIASVMGKKFNYQTLSDIYNNDIDDIIINCLKKGIFLSEQEYDDIGYKNFIFSHDIIRDNIYNRITRKIKCEIHEKVGNWYEKYINNFENIIENDLYSYLCFHFFNAKNIEKTIQYAMLAGKNFYDKYELSESLYYYELIDKYLDENVNLLEEKQIVNFIENYCEVMNLLSKNNEMLTVIEKYISKINFSDFNLFRINIKLLNFYEKISDIKNWEIKLKECDEIIEKINQKNNFIFKLKSVFYISMGKFLSLNNNYFEAMEWYKKSLELYEKIKDKKGISLCYKEVGNIYYYKNNFQKSMEYYDRSYKIIKTIDDKHGISNCLNNMGNIFLAKQKFNKAKRAYENALKIYNEIGDKLGVAGVYNNIGNISKNKKEYDIAISNYNKALAIYTEIENKKGISICFFNIGDALFQKNQFKESLGYFEKSLNIGRKIKFKRIVDSCEKILNGSIPGEKQNFIQT